MAKITYTILPISLNTAHSLEEMLIKNMFEKQDQENRKQSIRSLALTSILLLFMVGPLFGPLPRYLISNLSLHSAAAWLITAQFVALGIILTVVFSQMRQRGQKLSDLGWGQSSRLPAIILGLIAGLLWGALGIIGFIQMHPDINPFEINIFRVLFAVGGAIIAIGEDLITRGYVMNELHRLQKSTWLQISVSAILFALYHTVWNVTIIGFVASLIYGIILSGLFIFGKRSLTPVILAHSLALLISEPFLTMLLLSSIK